MQQARSSEQKVADENKIFKSAADSATFDPKALLAWVAVVQGATPADRRSGPNPSELALLLSRFGLFLRTQRVQLPKAQNVIWPRNSRCIPT
jgi:hypothetical protein